VAGALLWLSDAAWAAIEPHLPRNQPGARRVDDRRVISGIVHMLQCGGRWEDGPSDYGPSTTVYNRWNRWSRRGIRGRILSALTEEGWIAGPPDRQRLRQGAPVFRRHKRGLEPRPLAYRAVAGRRKLMHSSTSLDDRSALC
jgi:transposase